MTTTAGATPADDAGTAAGESGLPEGYDPARDAAADLRAALAVAARDGRNVLVDLGADWCPDCRALEALLRSPGVTPRLRRDYVLVRVDVGRKDRNLDLASRYLDLSTSGIPALVVLGPDGAVRATTADGSFAGARDMAPADVTAFLTRWSADPDG